MPRIAAASRSYLAVADAAGVMRDLSPWLESVSPLGKVVGWLDATGLNDVAGRTMSATETAQELRYRAGGTMLPNPAPTPSCRPSWAGRWRCNTGQPETLRVNAGWLEGSFACRTKSPAGRVIRCDLRRGSGRMARLRWRCGKW
jgi:hypothetical protein